MFGVAPVALEWGRRGWWLGFVRGESIKESMNDDHEAEDERLEGDPELGPDGRYWPVPCVCVVKKRSYDVIAARRQSAMPSTNVRTGVTTWSSTRRLVAEGGPALTILSTTTGGW